VRVGLLVAPEEAAMPKTIPAVPESITREQWVSLFESLGFNPADTRELRLAPDGAHAVVLARDAEGDPVVEGESFATHDIYVPVEG
jgi:hypothetical protein